METVPSIRLMNQHSQLYQKCGIDPTGLFTSVKSDGKPWGRIKIEETQITTCRNADLPPAA